MIISEVATGTSKWEKTPLNFNGKVEEFEQKPVEATPTSDEQKKFVPTTKAKPAPKK